MRKGLGFCDAYLRSVDPIEGFYIHATAFMLPRSLLSTGKKLNLLSNMGTLKCITLCFFLALLIFFFLQDKVKLSYNMGTLKSIKLWCFFSSF